MPTTYTEAPTAYELLCLEIDQLSSTALLLNASAGATRWLHEQDRIFTYRIRPYGEERSMVWLKEYRTQLQRMLIGLRDRQQARVEAGQQNTAEEQLHTASLVEQARSRVDAALLQAEERTAQRLAAAQQAWEQAQQAVSAHEAQIPDEAARPAWWSMRRMLQQDVEHAREQLDGAQIDHAAARRALAGGLRLAWAELTEEASEQCSQALEEAGQARDAAQAALEAVQAACTDRLRDLRAAQLLD